jgi:hypothetical protein
MKKEDRKVWLYGLLLEYQLMSQNCNLTTPMPMERQDPEQQTSLKNSVDVSPGMKEQYICVTVIEWN